MAIPDFQSLMLPILRLAADGNEHSQRESVERLAEEFGVTPQELEEKIPSGPRRFYNRVGWSLTYLRQAALLQATSRGRFRLTDQGRRVLADNPASVSMKYLERFPEYLAFKNRTKPSNDNPDKAEKVDSELTPEEGLGASYEALRRTLGEMLLDQVKQATPSFLETLVVDLLVAMGYGGSLTDAGRAVGQTGDGGIDGIIKEDKLGLDAVYVQAKRWDHPVGRPAVQSFAGSLDGVRARKGVFITTSRFSADARDYVSRIEKRIVLIDGEELAQLMMDHGIGVTTVATYAVQRVDTDYFEGAE